MLTDERYNQGGTKVEISTFKTDNVSELILAAKRVKPLRARLVSDGRITS